MLLVIYNSNPRNYDLSYSYKGWSLYTENEWAYIVNQVLYNYHHTLSGCLRYKEKTYYSLEEWLDDYQVSTVENHVAQSSVDILNALLGTDFFEPKFEDEPVYPEMDAYA